MNKHKFFDYYIYVMVILMFIGFVISSIGAETDNGSLALTGIYIACIATVLALIPIGISK